MLGLLVLLNGANLAIAATIKYGDLIGKAELQMNERFNVNILLLLTLVMFLELLLLHVFDSYPATLVLFRLLPSILEYLFVFRLFNRYMMFLHLPRERLVITQIFAALAALRKLFSYFYLEPVLPVLLLILFIEAVLSLGFLFATKTVLRHYRYLHDHEMPQWERDNYGEDVKMFKVTYFHRKVSIVASNFLLLFILNGTLWIVGFWLSPQAPDRDFYLEFEYLSLATRIVPHLAILLNYLFLYLRDQDHLRKEKNFVFELKEVLIYKDD